jgi:hypothetical protein
MELNKGKRDAALRPVIAAAHAQSVISAMLELVNQFTGSRAKVLPCL